MPASSHDELLSTTQAARAVNRTQGSVRQAIITGRLPATKHTADNTWRVRRADLLAWDERAHRSTVNRSRRPWEAVAELLADFDSASADELADVLGIHPGNARKYLAILATQGRAERHEDGQWVLAAAALKEVASRAS